MPRRTLCALLSTLLMLLGSTGSLLAQHEQAPEPNPPRIVNHETALPEQWFAPLNLGGAVEWTYHKTGDNAHPDGNEQQLMWLMNSARANPTQEGIWLATMTDPDVASARSYWGVNLVVLQAEFAGYATKPPAAFDVRLYNAAKAHSQDLIARDAQDHNNQFARISTEGFSYLSGRGNVFSYSKNALYGHAAFNIDWGSDGGDGSGMQPGRGHRMAIMSVDGSYTNVGIAVVPESNPGTSVGPQVITGNYCYANTGAADHYNRFIVGTVWTDSNGNAQYDPGEGIAGVTAKPDQGGFYAVTADSGGYAIPITASGTYTVSFSGSAINGAVERSVAVGSQSALLDFVYGSGAIVPAVNTSTATEVTSSSAKLNGTVNPNGSTSIYYFEYGPTTAYGNTTASYSTDVNTPVDIDVTGLDPDSTYHFRLVASNAFGTSYGVDGNLITESNSNISNSILLIIMLLLED